MEKTIKEYFKFMGKKACLLGCLIQQVISLKINIWKRDLIKYIKEEELIKEKKFLNIQKKSSYQCKNSMLRLSKTSKQHLESHKTLKECQLLNRLTFDQKHFLKCLFPIISAFLLESSMIEITSRLISTQKCFTLNQKWIG
jgi:hypothetical protein